MEISLKQLSIFPSIEGKLCNTPLCRPSCITCRGWMGKVRIFNFNLMNEANTFMDLMCNIQETSLFINIKNWTIEIMEGRYKKKMKDLEKSGIPPSIKIKLTSLIREILIANISFVLEKYSEFDDEENASEDEPEEEPDEDEDEDENKSE